MSELEAKRTTPVHVKNSNWATAEQLHEIFLWMTKPQTVVELAKEPEVISVTLHATETGQYIDLEPGPRGYITLTVDGDGEEFDATVAVLYQARTDGEFIPVQLYYNGYVECAETSIKSGIYRVKAAQGQAIRAVVTGHTSGDIFVTLTASMTGSHLA